MDQPILSKKSEAAQKAVRYDPQLRREYLHRCHQKPKKTVLAHRLGFVSLDYAFALIVGYLCCWLGDLVQRTFHQRNRGTDVGRQWKLHQF